MFCGWSVLWVERSIVDGVWWSVEDCKIVWRCGGLLASLA